MFQMLVLFRVRAARALKREIPNPPYQGGKATEAIRWGIIVGLVVIVTIVPSLGRASAPSRGKARPNRVKAPPPKR